MFLYETFPSKLIMVALEAEDKDEVFEEMVDQFCQVEDCGSRDEILEALLEREAKMSTGIHKGIAVPHGKSTAVENIHGILGISRKGIDYDALDGQPVYILFMLLVPKEDSEMHLRLLKRLAGLLDNQDFCKEILAHNDPRSVNGVIRKFEDDFLAS